GSAPVPEGVWEWINLCEEGSAFYESLAKPGESLKGVKRLVLAALYASNREKNPRIREMQDRLTRRFPAVMKVARAIKAKDHYKLACLMQNAEATLMIYNVCGRLMKERPEIPLVPVHDAIYTVPKYLKAVAAIVKAEFAPLGVTPKLKVKS